MEEKKVRLELKEEEVAINAGDGMEQQRLEPSADAATESLLAPLIA